MALRISPEVREYFRSTLASRVTSNLRSACLDAPPHSHLLSLPVELSTLILSKLDTIDQVCAALTCKDFAATVISNATLCCNSPNLPRRFHISEEAPVAMMLTLRYGIAPDALDFCALRRRFRLALLRRLKSWVAASRGTERVMGICQKCILFRSREEQRWEQDHELEQRLAKSKTIGPISPELDYDIMTKNWCSWNNIQCEGPTLVTNAVCPSCKISAYEFFCRLRRGMKKYEQKLWNSDDEAEPARQNALARKKKNKAKPWPA